jgi:hypothetical protein
MSATRLAGALRASTAEVLVNHGLEAVSGVLTDPGALLAFDEAVTNLVLVQGGTPGEVCGLFRDVPFVLLPSAFTAGDLPETPSAFLPVPVAMGTVGAAMAAVTLGRLLEFETVAYRAENAGHPFVNLVALPGDGRMPAKSRGSMRGHTDAVTFPFPGTRDPETPRIAPSPDWVCLACLRNPDSIPTRVTPLNLILAGLQPSEVAALRLEQFLIGAQDTFAAGLKEILGLEHQVDGGALLHGEGIATAVRFSHRRVTASEYASEDARQALAKVEQLCNAHAVPIATQPGDLLWVNNRLALHGRAEVGGEIGGQSRWLMRSYSLSSAAIQPDQRYADSGFQLFP